MDDNGLDLGSSVDSRVLPESLSRQEHEGF